MYSKRDLSRSVFLFCLAGLCEIGGGYLVWVWLRADHSFLLGMIGGFVLFLYGIVPTLQKSYFHRTYAAYGGIFIVLSILWGWLIDRVNPDMYDVTGALIAIFGVIIIFYYPRRE